MHNPTKNTLANKRIGALEVEVEGTAEAVTAEVVSTSVVAPGKVEAGVETWAAAADEDVAGTGVATGSLAVAVRTTVDGSVGGRVEVGRNVGFPVAAGASPTRLKLPSGFC